MEISGPAAAGRREPQRSRTWCIRYGPASRRARAASSTVKAKSEGAATCCISWEVAGDCHRPPPPPRPPAALHSFLKPSSLKLLPARFTREQAATRLKCK